MSGASSRMHPSYTTEAPKCPKTVAFWMNFCPYAFSKPNRQHSVFPIPRSIWDYPISCRQLRGSSGRVPGAPGLDFETWDHGRPIPHASDSGEHLQAVLLDDGEELEGHAAGLFYAALPLLHGGLAGVEVASKDRGRPTHRMEQRRDEWDTRLRAKGPGLKPLDSMGLIQWAEAHCSLRKAKTGVYPQPVKPLLPP